MAGEPPTSTTLPGFVFDPRYSELRDAATGQRVPMRPQTAGMLRCLASAAGHVVPKDDLLRTVWPNVVVTEDSLVQCVRDLRRVLGDEEHRIVQTEPKVGYRLVAQQEAPATFKQDIRFATSSDGVRIAYAISGDGPPLVRTSQWMTHVEWDWRSAVFGEFLSRLSVRSRLVRYDARGCGLSDRGVPMATLDDELRDLEAVVDAAGLDRFALLGRSQGGAISIRYAARHPDRVSRLVIIGGYARGVLFRGAKSQTMESVNAFCRVLEDGWGDENSALRQVWTSYAFPGATKQQQDAYNCMQRVTCSPQDAAKIHLRNARFDSLSDLASVQCPTLVLHNPADALIPFEEGRLIASGIQGARLETFESRNHQPLSGEPAFEQVMNLIDDFLHDGVIRPA